MRSFLKFLFVLFLILLVPMQMASAQVFDPISRSAGGVVSGKILNVGPPPVVTGTGTPTIATGSTNISGIVTAGASATSVVITFSGSGAFWGGSTPSCSVTTQSGPLAAFAYTVSTTAITITQTATSGNLINYNCQPMA